MSEQPPADPPPSSPAPEPRLHREGFSRPETLAERLGYATERVLARLGIGLVLLTALLVVVIGVPLHRVSRTDEVAWARAFLERSEAVEQAVGPVESVGLPRRWRLEPKKATFTFPVRGSRGDGQVELVLEEVQPWGDGARSFRLVEGRITDPNGRSWPLRGRRPR